MRTLTWLLLAALPSTAAEPDEDGERWAALTYVINANGVSFATDTKANTVTLSLDPAKGVTPERIQRWISKFYLPALDHCSGWGAYEAERQKGAKDFESLAKAKAHGWVFMEPVKARRFCKQLATGFRDATLKKRAEDYCMYVPASTAKLQLLEFDGTPVTYPAGVGYGGKLFYDSKLFQKRADGTYDPTLILPGYYPLNGGKYVRVQQELLADVKPDNQFFQKAQADLAKNKPFIEQQEKVVAALEKKQAGKGGVVVFADKWFEAWDAVEAASGALDCENTFFKAYGPENGHQLGEGIYQFATQVDGDECSSVEDEFKAGWTKSWPVQLGGPIFTGRHDDCSEAVLGIGKHKVDVEIWSVKSVRTDRYEVLSNGTLHWFIASQRVARVGSGSVTCETKTDKLRKVWVK